MPAYVIFIREQPVHDEDAMAEYRRLNRASAAGHALKPLVVYGKVEALEGSTPDGVVVLEFPDAEQARAWYRSPAYQAALPHRMRGAEYRALIVEGIVKPA